MDTARAAGVCFSTDYAAARAKFLDACGGLGVAVESHVNPLAGPRGELLSTDTAWLGPDDASEVVVVISGTHGVEGFCGGGAQVDWLLDRGAAALPPGTAVLLIHAANPFGWAWLARCTEENVDLNRNWLDFTQPLPDDDGYDALASHLVPAEMDGPARAAADAALAAWREGRTPEQWLRAVSSGQYRHPDGLFYGGRAPTWSRRTSERIIDRHRLAQRRNVTVLDVHTGLGPYGQVEAISHMPQGSAARERVLRMWGGIVKEPVRGGSVSTLRRGLAALGWRGRIGPHCVFVTFEFGTSPVDEVLDALRGECWARRRGLDRDDPLQHRVRAASRRAFYPDTDGWRGAVLAQMRRCIGQALQASDIA